MRQVLYQAVPFCREEAAQALEAGVSGLVVPAENLAAASSLARCVTLAESDLEAVDLSSRADEERASALIQAGRRVMLRRGWEIIPVENLLAREHIYEKSGLLALEVATPQEARLASGVLERGADCLVVTRGGLQAIPAIMADIRTALGEREAALPLTEAEITEITPVGMGHRVCVDTTSVLASGQGMLVGNSAAFCFLVNAESEASEYVAARPFRVNAGAVHGYAMLPGDKTAYLEELGAGAEVLIVDRAGAAFSAVIGRVKVERRPMLLIRARAGEAEGAIFLQNAETIRLVQTDGTKSVVALEPGDRVLCRLDAAGRHFGLRITESIKER